MTFEEEKYILTWKRGELLYKTIVVGEIFKSLPIQAMGMRRGARILEGIQLYIQKQLPKSMDEREGAAFTYEFKSIRLYCVAS